MRNIHLASAGVAALLAAAGEARAADADAEAGATTSVEEIVITAQSRADVVQVGAFRNARVIDTPLTVNVITRDVIDAQAAMGLFNALKNTGGVTRSQLNGATYDNIAIRGILVENRGNYRLNGALPVINLVEQPLEDKVRVEVLKGASGLYYGFVPPSGVINMTTKRAEADPTAAVTFRGDDNGTRIASIDLGQRFHDGMFGVRVNAAAGQIASFQDYVKGDRQLLALALDFKPTDKLSFRFDGEYIAKDIPEPGALALPAVVAGVVTLPARPPARRNLSGKWAHYDADARNFLLRMDYQFNEVFALKLEGGRAQTNRNRFFSQFQNYNLTTGAGTLQVSLADGQKYVNDNGRGELSAAFDTGPIRHQAVAGYTENKRYQNGRVNQSFSFAQNLYNPVVIPGPPRRTIGLQDAPSTIRDKGAYVFDRIEVGDQWQAIVGLRRSDYESVARNVAGVITRYAAKKTSPAVSLIYKPRPFVSLYGSYLEGFEEGGIAPANNVNAFEILPPAKTRQVEAGAKAEIGKVVASLAGFEIKRPSAYTNGANRFVLDGEVEYRGVEFAAFGDVSDRISITASALMLDAEQKRAANPLVIGKRPENTPKWTASLFGEWRVPAVDGLALNAGVFAMGARAVNAANQGFIGGYATVDAGVRYTREIDGRTLTGQINVENLFDKGYWSTAGNNLLGVGAPRTVKVTISAAI
ncbi:MAG: TonB-dependent siderophore receptor [Phenylobacterium sp.]|uniref:TonB-dependent siderophore receptor n=1 Tax=Phenylobacterium sp. TaxID=1871053 RepID=UPI001A54AE7E|nr:TonB-dependent siderophore receptor [Phenylobacterium sp.]MBL8555984.1 TonB-dependent siderophore receptor [Phenylobacterium sp.]